MDAARPGTRRVIAEVAALAWLVVLAGAFLAPALSHGSAIGPYDLLGTIGLTAHANAHVHNVVGSDEIQQFIPWQALSWRLVHAGHLPLWNPANLLGMPLAFNFQSAPFSLASAISYAFPLGSAHTATIVTELVLAGSGTYVLCRVLGLRALPSTLGATVFELCGAFTIWLGSYEPGVCCLLGWVLAASVLLLRGRRRAVPAVLLALGLALAFAAGEPQIDAFFVVFVGVFVLVVLWRRGKNWETLGASGCGDLDDGNTPATIGTAAEVPAGGQAAARVDGTRSPQHLRRRILLDHVLALLAAAGLVSPIYLPGSQDLLHSARVHGPFVSSLPPHDLTHLLFAGYSGVPTNLTSLIGPDNLYVSMVYVGAVGLVFAFAGLAWVRRRPAALAFGVLAVGLGIVLFFPPIATLLRHIPEAKFFRLDLGTTFLDFALAMLAAYGAAGLLGRSPTRGRRAARVEPAVGRWADRLFVAAIAFLAIVLSVLWSRLGVGLGHLHAAQSSVRTASFLWPTIAVAACAIVAGARMIRPGVAGRSIDAGNGGSASGGDERSRETQSAARRNARGRWRTSRAIGRGANVIGGPFGIGLLVVVEAAFCIISGAWFLSSTSQPLRVTPAIAALRKEVGSNLVGMGACTLHSFPDLGIMPDVNVAYGVNEFVDYDPIMTTQYYASLAGLHETSKTPPMGGNSVFCPAVTSVRMARYYGISFILEPPGGVAPAGTNLVASVHGEGLYAVPGSGRATLVPATTGVEATFQRATVDGEATVQRATETKGGTWRIGIDAHRRSLLILRVTSVPGWDATIDGKPLAVRSYGSVMLAATVPPGRHLILLHYWPRLWSLGLLIGAISAAALLVVLLEAARRRYASARRGHGSSQEGRHVRVEPR